MSGELEKLFGPEVLTALDERMRRIACESRPSSLPDEDRGLSTAEAAVLLGVKKWRVYEMVKRKVLRAYRPSPRTLRILLSSVNECLREGRT
jgi:excisionase family DNA binding protein